SKSAKSKIEAAGGKVVELAVTTEGEETTEEA
ncbi:MAG: ribosomal protein L18E, partial [Lentimonas sp.]